MVLVPLFILGLAYINFRGVAESVKLNVVMTCVELAGLLIVILIGAWALSQGIGEPARALEFNAGAEPFSLVVSGAALAFFAIIGFEDSVNMVEETTNPQRDFPRAFFIGITITGIVYMLVAFFTTALVPIEVLRDTDQDLLEVVRVGAPWFPLVLFSFIAMVAVGNTSLINLMMASRLLYGMSNERAIPPLFGAVHERRRTPWVAIICTTALALLLASWSGVRTLGGTTALLLLCVFALVNAAVLLLRGQRVDHAHYRAPTLCPVLGLVSCVYLASPFAGRETAQYVVAGVLLLLGIALFVLNAFLEPRRSNRQGYVGAVNSVLLAFNPLGEIMAAQPQDIAHTAPVEIDRRVYELYDEYCHGRMDRREFLARASALVIGGLAMAQALFPRYVEAQTISFTDERIKAKYVEYP